MTTIASPDSIEAALSSARIIRVKDGREAGTYRRTGLGVFKADDGRYLRVADADHLIHLGRAEVVEAADPTV